MKSPRLREQGFSNLHRKLIFRLLAIALAAYLFYIPNPWPLHETLILGMRFSGTLLMFTGILGRIFSTLSIGGLKDRVIVRTELYSVCRNPLYFSSFLMAVGTGLLFARLDFTVLLIAAFMVVFFPMMRNEARILRGKYPDYAEYERSVPLFFPNFLLWQERREFTINHRLLKRTLLDSSLILLVIPVMLLSRCVPEPSLEDHGRPGEKINSLAFPVDRG
jgi:protein-S-isoprenylcysteine O-methyltransferase Ste14